MMRRFLQDIAAFMLLAAPLMLPACTQPHADTVQTADPIAVVTLGGGTSHDYDRWFDEEDSELLRDAGVGAGYTDVPGDLLGGLDTLDVLRITNNQPLPDPALREAIFNFVDDGNGLIVGHAGAWYNWNDWPEYNEKLVGGGSRSHQKYGAFEVNVVAPDHPIMADVPSSFTIDDELYRFEPDPAGSPIEVLATAEETETGDVYPIVWTVDHGRSRIVVNTLGHDGAAHQHPAYAQILKNSVLWVGRRAD